MEQRWRRPRYLAQNFLASALQHRRGLLEKMLIAPPQHMEFVEGYVHRGWVNCGKDGEEYDKPWKWLKTDKDLSGSICCHVDIAATSLHGEDESLANEIQSLRLTSTGGVQLESYELLSETTRKSDRDETGSDLDLFLLSQDIDSAIDRFLPSSSPSSTHSNVRNDARIPREEFLPVKINDWDLTTCHDTTENISDHILEQPESPLHLTGLLSLMPTADDLVSRLKPKLIHDPLLDDTGKPFTHQKFFSVDLKLSADFTRTSKHSICVAVTTSECQFEEFSRDDSAMTHAAGWDDLDPILEMCIMNDEDNEGKTRSIVSTNDPPLPSPDKEFMDEVIKDSHSNADMLKLSSGETTCIDKSALCRMECERSPLFSPSPQRLSLRKSEPLDFVKLGNHDISHDSDDSGLGYALLESPLLPPPLSPPTSTPITRQLAGLEPFPLSPTEERMMILSPSQKRKVELLQWQRDKVFDAVLALTLPYPDTDCGGLSDTGNTVADALLKLNVKKLKLDGDTELELTWDPLTESCHEMILAEQSLISKHPFDLSTFVAVSSKHKVSGNWKERFEYDSWAKSINEDGAEMPLSFGLMTYSSQRKSTVVDTSDGQHAHSDIPSLNLVSGYRCQPTSNKASRRKSLSNGSQVDDISLSDNSCKDPRSAAWEILELSNSRVSSRSSSALQFYSSSLGNKITDGQRTTRETFRSLPRGLGYRSRQFSSPGAAELSDVGDDGELGSFMMMRYSESTPERREEASTKERDDFDSDGNGGGNSCDLELVWSGTVTAPSIRDVVLPDEYQSAVDKLKDHTSCLMVRCQTSGLRVQQSCSFLQRDFPADSVKFFLKEQQKMLEDVRNTERAGEVFHSCQLAAGLYVAGSVLDVLTHCSLSTAIGTFTSLTQKYAELLHQSSSIVEPVREGLSGLQMAYRERRVDPHPKLTEMMNIVRHWKKSLRKSWREKMVVVIAREFNALSGDVLDFLQAIPGLKSCVFSFSSSGHSDPLYAKAIEERFLHYDCVVTPESSITGQTGFPWEKVTLLIEYEPLKCSLFDQPSGDDASGDSGSAVQDKRVSVISVKRLRLKEYVTLKTAFKSSNKDLQDTEDVSLYQYKFIGSENVIQNTQLLHLLESNHNIVIVERDYHTSFKQQRERKTRSSNPSYADLIIDAVTGILLRPMSQLGSDAGLKTLISTITALSFQLEACWVLLFTESNQQYPFSGCAPTNLARLHASVSHYSPTVDSYQVKVLLTSGLEETAKLVRRVAEDRHRNSNVWHMEEWLDRSWLKEEITEREKVLLSFPCLNSFSAQLMLSKSTLADVLAMDLQHLHTSFPWMPVKSVKLFHKICHVNAMAVGDHFNVNPSAINPVSTSTSGFEDNHTTPAESSYSTSSNQSCQGDSNAFIKQKAFAQKDRSHHVRFNVCDLPSCTGGSGSTDFEEPSDHPDVIVLTSDDDDERPPSPKRVRREHTEDVFPTSEFSKQSFFTDFDKTRVSTLNSRSHDLNDSLEEYELQHQLECPLAEGQGAITSHERVSIDQRPLAQVEHSMLTFTSEPDHHQSRNIYGNLSAHCDVSGRSSEVEQRHTSYSNSSSIFDPPVVEPSTAISSSSNSAFNLLKSTSWEGKTPTQKQIRETVMNSISRIKPKPGAHDPFPPPNNHVTNTARMAREFFSGDPPPGFMAGAIVRSTPPDSGDDRATFATSTGVERTPVKSLNLGNEDRQRVWLQSNDRSLASTSGSQSHNSTNRGLRFPNTLAPGSVSFQQHQRAIDDRPGHSSKLTPANYNNNIMIEGSYPNMRRSFVRSEREKSSTINRFADLKTFHQLQHPPMATVASGKASEPIFERDTNNSMRRGLLGQTDTGGRDGVDDPWMGCGVIGPSVRAKRPHPGMGKPSTSHQPLLADSLVPSTSCNVLSPTTSIDSSLYGSPNTSTGSVKLTPLTKKGLTYKRDPTTSNGQTKLHFR